ncbi:MAG: hypothetical protein ABWK01_07580 [Infirmifilum sp.]
MPGSSDKELTRDDASLSQELPKEVFQGDLKGQDVIVCDEKAVEAFTTRGYGFREWGCVRLTLLEAAYLVYRGFLIVKDDMGGEKNFESLVSMGSSLDPDFWTRLNVYADLRNRALIAQPGVQSQEFLLDWKRKDKAKRYLVRIVREGSRLSFREFEEMFRRALESDRELVVAIVDKEGVISYYIVEGVLREGLPEVEGSDEVSLEQEG